VDAKHKLTLGALMGLVCDGTGGGGELLKLSGVPSKQREPLAAACGALRGKKRRGLYEGLEVRNGLAHGYASLPEVQEWAEMALGPRGPLAKLAGAVMGSLHARSPKVGVLEDPFAIRGGTT
jgi:hypothetical protein